MKIEKVQKLVSNWQNKTRIHIRDKFIKVRHIRNLKEILNHGLVLKKIHKVVKFNQETLLKLYEQRIRTKR